MVKYTIVLIALASKLALMTLNAGPTVQPWSPDPGCVPGDNCDS